MDVYSTELLSALKAEEKALQKEIRNALNNEQDYYTAHQLQKGLNIVRNKIRNVERALDPFYDQKEQIQREIMWEKRLEKIYKNYPTIISHKRSHRINLENKLEELNTQFISPNPDTQFLDEAFFGIIEKRTKCFKLWLNKESNFFLKVADAGSNLEIKLLPEEVSKEHRLYTEKSIRQIKGLGFAISEDEREWVYRYPKNSFRDANELKVLLARIIYDVFPYGVSNPVFLAYDNEYI